MNIPTFYSAVGVRMEGLFNAISGSGHAEKSAVVRGDMIEFGLNEGIKTPLLGHGFDSFQYFYGKSSGVEAYAHNNFVELFFDLGLVGFIIYYFFYVYILRNGISRKCDTAIPFRAFSVALIGALMFFEFGAITYSVTPIIVIFYLAFAGQEIRDEEEEA